MSPKNIYLFAAAFCASLLFAGKTYEGIGQPSTIVVRIVFGDSSAVLLEGQSVLESQSEPRKFVVEIWRDGTRQAYEYDSAVTRPDSATGGVANYMSVPKKLALETWENGKKKTRWYVPAPDSVDTVDLAAEVQPVGPDSGSGRPDSAGARLDSLGARPDSTARPGR